jgi:Na+/H+-dicarboxylate symporter
VITLANIKKFKLILTLLSIIAGVALFGQYVPTEIKSISYALSLTMKGVLVLLLPFLIFSFLFYSLVSLRGGAVLFVILLISLVACSNFIAIMTGYTVGSITLPFIDVTLASPSNVAALAPAWKFSLSSFITNEPALVAGLVLGSYFSFRPSKLVESISRKLNGVSMYFLKTVFLPTLPIFILGFVFKLEHEQVLQKIFGSYAPILMIIITTQVCYTFMLYMLAADFNIKKCIGYIRNIIPATLTGFSTISSAATMPVTIACTERNLDKSSLARTIVPTTANIHTLGSAIGVTILSLGTILAFGRPVPELMDFIYFAFYYTLAKFAVTGIPGGVILVISPLLESYLSFTPDMVGLITAIYLLFDPFGTATNVTCNGAFAIIFSKIYRSSVVASPDEIEEDIRVTH